jgi:hypothetical protein
VHVVFRLTGRVVYITATNVAFRKDVWTGYATQLTQGGDELDLLRRLQAKGKVVFERGHPTFTSARRMHRGLMYNLVVTCTFYYLIGYNLNRLLGRRVLGTAPEIRTAPVRRRAPRLLMPTVMTMLMAVVLAARFTDIDLA